MKLFLLDAYALIYRSYYAFIKNPRMNSKGMNTSAMFGFVNTLQEIIDKEKPTHIAVAFDPPGGTFRHDAYEEYKAHREATPEDIKIAVPYIKKIISGYNIKQLEVPKYEADDVIGTIAKQAEKKGFEVFMLTPDKDYAQLTTNNIYLYRPKLGFSPKEVLNSEGVQAKYDLEYPMQMIDYLALIGDTADNIPGCPGVGEKTATKLLKEWGSVENIINNSSKIKGKLGEKITENSKQIEFSKFLATIATDVPIEFDADEFLLRQYNEEKLTEIFTELEFRTQATRILKKEIIVSNDLFSSLNNDAQSKQDIQDDKLIEYVQTIDNLDIDYKFIENENSLDSMISELSNHSHLALALLHDNLDNPTESRLFAICFSVSKNKAFYLPMPKNDEEKLNETLSKIKIIIENEDIEKIGSDLKNMSIVLSNYGIKLQGAWFDNSLAHYLLNPEISHNLDFMVETVFQHKLKNFDELISKKYKKKIDKIEHSEACDYVCEIADFSLQLSKVLKEKIKEENLAKLLFSIELPLAKVLSTMEINGIKLDKETLNESSKIMNSKLEELEKEIYLLADEEFNINSPKQLGEILFDKLKLVEKPKKTKTGQYVTGEEVLLGMKELHPIIHLILEYRGLRKLVSTYIDALPQLVSKKDERIHTTYNQTVTATGRLSSSNPNLQNIPVRTNEGREIRKAFTVDKGNLFLSADYSQIELRLMAHLSQDEDMIEAFSNNKDIHASTAAKIYKVSIAEVTSRMRNNAKTANFGIIYGISAFGLSQRLDIPRTEAKELIDGYFSSYKSVKNYIEKSIEMAKEKGYTETLLGRKRFLPDINSRNAVVRGFAERNAVNAPIQGTAADIIKLAMIKIQHRFVEENLSAKMILQVHDELNFEVPENEIDKVKEIVLHEMQNVIKLRVPLIAEFGIGNNWFDAH